MRTDLNQYEDAWTAEIYDCQVGDSVGDLAFWQALAEECGGEALELACGTGRLTLPLARAGIRITGVDCAPHTLAVARRKLAEEPPEVQACVSLIEGDMRALALERQFPLVFIPFNSFQFMLEQEDQQQCLGCCAAHLAPRGRLVIDGFNANTAPLPVTPEEHGPAEFVGPEGVPIRMWVRTECDRVRQRIFARWRYESTSAAGDTRRFQRLMELRYFFYYEMAWMLEACGFVPEAVYGDYGRNPFGPDSPKMIFVVRR